MSVNDVTQLSRRINLNDIVTTVDMCYLKHMEQAK